MSLEELTYVAILGGSLPIGFIFKHTGRVAREVGSMLVGLTICVTTSGWDTLHSLVTIIGTWVIIHYNIAHCRSLTLMWTFGYLLFFRTMSQFGLPHPGPFANAAQLLLTLKMVSLASEVNTAYTESQQTRMENGPKRKVGLTEILPSIRDMVCYSYCYLGIMTGPFYRFRTHQDWLYEPHLPRVPSWRPMVSRLRMVPVFASAFVLLSRFCPLQYVSGTEFALRSVPYRLYYMSLVFLVFRLRFYAAWLSAEAACVSAGLGAYPTQAHSKPGNGPTRLYPHAGDGLEYDYETIKNIDPWNTDMCVSVKDGMKYWNMTVQWWLANYIYKHSPFSHRILRIAWTMLVSAFWHGVHAGYYLSFLTVPLCLAAEGAMDLGVRSLLPPSGLSRKLYDFLHWFSKMRAYDYMCLGFVLLHLSPTLACWSSVGYYVHWLSLAMLVVGYTLSRLLGKARPPPSSSSSPSASPVPSVSPPQS